MRTKGLEQLLEAESVWALRLGFCSSLSRLNASSHRLSVRGSKCREDLASLSGSSREGGKEGSDLRVVVVEGNDGSG